MELEALIGRLADAIGDAIIITDAQGHPGPNIVWCNAAFTKQTGYALEEVRGKSPRILQGQETDPDMVRRLRAGLETWTPVRGQLLNYRKDGVPFWIDLSLTPVADDTRWYHYWIGVQRDITALVQLKQDLEGANRRLAENADALARAKNDAEIASCTDPLTGLGNRRALDDRLRSLVGSANSDSVVSILHLDLDHFKSINDAFGHPAGDHVIRHIARVLTECVRPGDLIARVGGDEFVLVLFSPPRSDFACTVAERIIARCREPIRFADKELHVGASIGIATGAPSTAACLLVDADIALYEAKREGRHRSAVFTPRLRAMAEKRKRIADELVKALADDHFVPFFQPQVAADTGEFVGVEALVRWRHRSEGLVSPGLFLPIAEDLGLMSEIDEIILAKSLGMVGRLKEIGVSVPKISVNVSYRRLKDSGLGRQLGHSDTWPCRIAFELLETIDFDRGSDEIAFILDDLKERGVEIEVDDFGSGRASITTLLRIRPKRIKIDRQLVGVVASDLPREIPILRAIGQMGKSLGFEMTAEGVETETQARALRRIGCDVLQGHLYCAAIPEAELGRWIVERPDLSRRSRSA